IDAGIKIGHLIHEHAIDIEVVDYCISCCANYLFTAAVHKTIHDGAMVVWHGNSQQKDFREFDQCNRTTSSFDGMPMDQDEIDALSSPEAQLEWQDRREREQAFFQRIGVNEFIARVGQEPVFVGDFTMTVADMHKFGVTNVSAPSAYASAEHCQTMQTTKPSLACIAVTAAHFDYEQARRRYGEVCAEDGTLLINSTP
ncbi:MAG: hypothetical protein LAT66_05425, partial [Alkalimonas sp.]|nr:hypothetical protein [Alkalimonas sp.]